MDHLCLISSPKDGAGFLETMSSCGPYLVNIFILQDKCLVELQLITLGGLFCELNSHVFEWEYSDFLTAIAKSN